MVWYDGLASKQSKTAGTMVASRRRFGVWEAHLDVSWTNKSTATLAVRFLEVQYCLYRT